MTDQASSSAPGSTVDSVGGSGPPVRNGRAGLTPRSLVTFFVATFVLSWGSGALYIAFQEQADRVFGPMGYTNPVFIFLVYAPGIVGVAMVLWHHGLAGLRGFASRLLLWRMSPVWWVTLLVGMPAVFYAGALVAGTIDESPGFSPWYTVVPALLAMLFIGPIEELGWRGVALPLLQRRLAPLWASLLLGVIVATWHTPAFFLSGTKQSAWAFWPFFFGVVAISVILTAMFNAAAGSLLVAVIFHAQMNNPLWPDAQPWDMWLFVVVAMVIAVLDRRHMLDRGYGATDVVPAARRA